MAVLVTQEGALYQLVDELREMSGLIQATLSDQQDEDEDDAIPLPCVSSASLMKIIDFCVMYKKAPMPPIERPLPDDTPLAVLVGGYADLVEDLSFVELCELMSAADYLEVNPLVELVAAKIASIAQKSSPEQLLAMFA